MAYNYEYPYIDADRYNVDWILKRIKELHERLMKEIAEREEGYKYLFEKLETETTEREQADTDLRNELMDQVAEEQKRAEEAEGRIQRNLEALTQQVTQNAAENAREHAVLRDAINSIEEELNAEEEARKAADKDLSDRLESMDSDLNGRIDDLGTQLGEEITDNKEAIEKERAERIEQDGQIRNELAADSAAHTAAENALSRDLSEEAKKREEMDSALSGDIHAEQQRAQAAEALLQQDINDEVTARTEADNALSDRLTREQDAREAADEKEAADRKAADEDLQRKLDEEAEFRGKADDALKAELRTEERVREAKDAIIEQNLNAEKDRAQKAENQLDLDVKNEAAARQAEDRTLYGRIGDEEAERKTADQRIEGLITGAQNDFTAALEQEKTERQAADTTIQESVTQEQERAQGEEQRIEGLITDETKAREQADTNIQGQFADDLANTEEELREYVDSKVVGGGDITYDQLYQWLPKLDIITSEYDTIFSVFGIRIDKIYDEIIKRLNFVLFGWKKDPTPVAIEISAQKSDITNNIWKPVFSLYDISDPSADILVKMIDSKVIDFDLADSNNAKMENYGKIYKLEIPNDYRELRAIFGRRTYRYQVDIVKIIDKINEGLEPITNEFVIVQQMPGEVTRYDNCNREYGYNFNDCDKGSLTEFNSIYVANEGQYICITDKFTDDMKTISSKILHQPLKYGISNIAMNALTELYGPEYIDIIDFYG